jgi:ribonuclease HI
MSDVRKRFYAVVRGKRPGIYRTWDGPAGAQAQVKGFPGALFKGFTTLSEAQHFLATASTPDHRPPPEGRTTPKPARPTPSTRGDIQVYTDGGCINNPGPGGWAAVVLDGGNRMEMSGGYRLTTNNRMELQACIQALRSIRKKVKIDVVTDSQYVANAVQKGWALRWRSRNWMRDRMHRAENSDLWAELLELLDHRDVTFHWVRGHAGNQENERCDELARRAALGMDLVPDEGYEKSRDEPDAGPALFD